MHVCNCCCKSPLLSLTLLLWRLRSQCIKTIRTFSSIQNINLSSSAAASRAATASSLSWLTSMCCLMSCVISFCSLWVAHQTVASLDYETRQTCTIPWGPSRPSLSISTSRLLLSLEALSKAASMSNRRASLPITKCRRYGVSSTQIIRGPVAQHAAKRL